MQCEERRLAAGRLLQAGQRSQADIARQMGVSRMAEIAAQLIAHGRAADTPAAVIRQGTTADQETVVGTLATIAADVERAGLGAPATLVVGEVVRLRERLSWFDALPHLTARLETEATDPIYVVRES